VTALHLLTFVFIFVVAFSVGHPTDEYRVNRLSVIKSEFHLVVRVSVHIY